MGRTISKKTNIKTQVAGRSFSEFLPLSNKERELLETCRTGLPREMDQAIPYIATPENMIRASFVRFLLLGGDNAAPVCDQGVVLSNAWIQGELEISSSQINSSFIFLYCVFEDTPDFTDASVRGTASFYGCTLPGIYAQRLLTSGSLEFSNSAFKGKIELEGARIGSSLAFQGMFLLGTGSNAIYASNIQVGGSVRLDHGCDISGRIDFSDAQIDGVFIADNSTFKGDGAVAILADRVKVRGGVFFRNAFFAGTCRFVGASVAGAFNFRKTKFESNNEFSLIAENSLIGSDIDLTGIEANAEIRLIGAKVERSIILSAAQISSKGGPTFNAERAVVNGSLFFTNGFRSNGEIRLNAIHVNGNMRFSNSSVVTPGKTIVAEGMVVQKGFMLRSMKEPVNRISLSSSIVGRIIDDESSWGTNLILGGFEYESFAGNSPSDWQSRLNWLDKQKREHAGRDKNSLNFKRQPWHQLRRVLLKMGHVEDARLIGVKFEDRLREAGLIGRLGVAENSARAKLYRLSARVIHRTYGVLIGYGYQPAKLVAWMVSVWLVCGAVFWYAANENVMAPSNPLIFQNDAYAKCKLTPVSPNNRGKVVEEDKINSSNNWYYCNDLPPEFTGFSPLAYSLDLLLPVVNLQQENDWAPKIPTPKTNWLDELTALTLQHLVRLVVWAEILFGWVASLLLVAVVSGLTRKSDE